MRKIEYIVLHCTATATSATPEAIQRYWKENLGWKRPGYHYIIDGKGQVHQLARESEVTNGVAGWNSQSIHVSYIGGDKTGNILPEQVAAMLRAVKSLKKKYPHAKVRGHRDFPGVKKLCPNFDYHRLIISELE